MPLEEHKLHKDCEEKQDTNNRRVNRKKQLLCSRIICLNNLKHSQKQQFALATSYYFQSKHFWGVGQAQ